jgi:hypothetical protein
LAPALLLAGAAFLFAPMFAFDAFELDAFEFEAFELAMFAFDEAALVFAGAAALVFAGLLALLVLALLAAGSDPPQAIIPPMTRVSEMAVSVFFIDLLLVGPSLRPGLVFTFGGLVR